MSHYVSDVTIEGDTKKLCITCGNDGDTIADGTTPSKEQLLRALAHRVKHGRCKDCWPK